jgi:protein-arginine kinase activator protein McsA
MRKERESGIAEKGGSSEKDDEEEKTCPTCDTPVRFVKKYNRYWCKECKKYTPKK